MIAEELDEPAGDYEHMGFWKPHSDRSGEKRTEFVGKFLAMFDNDPSKSIRSIARDMGVSEFLIRQQVVHEDIRYFSYNLIGLV